MVRAWIGERGGRFGPWGHDAMQLVGMETKWIERGEREAWPAVYWMPGGQGSTNQNWIAEVGIVDKGFKRGDMACKILSKARIRKYCTWCR